jgi:predicted aspartyl protease
MIVLMLAFAVALAAHAPAQTPQSDAPAQTLQDDPAATTEATSETSVAASLSDSERMLVSVKIGAAGPYPFIVDTAAERTVIARELARELALRPAGRARLLSITSSRETGRVHVPDVSFLPGETLDLQAFALNGQHIGASGVLGIDALRGQRVVLDFEARALRVGPAPRRAAPPETNEIIVRARRRLGQLVLADCVIDGEPVDVVVDSGSQVSLGNDALRRILVTRQNEFKEITLTSITGESLTADYTRADRLVIGGVALIGMPVAFADAHFFRRVRLTRRPALLLGMDALQMFTRVSVDFPNRRASFVLPDNAQPAPAAPTN